MSHSKAPQFPLSGGDYIDDGTGLVQVAKPTAPPVLKSARQVQAAPPPRPDKPLVGDKPVKPT